jgi:hypothetical protein
MKPKKKTRAEIKAGVAVKKARILGSDGAKANRIGAGKFQFCDRPM